MTTIHASTLPRILSCPASLVAPELTVAGDDESSRIGQATHAALAEMVRGNTINLQAIGKRFDLQEQDFAAFYHIGRNMWSEYSDALQVLTVEQKMDRQILPSVYLLGTADVIAQSEIEQHCLGVIVDWKTGLQRSHRDQLIGYPLLAQDLFLYGSWKIMTFWLREQQVDIEDISLDEIRVLPGRIEKAIASPTQFNPTSENCEFCPRRLGCPAHNALVKSSLDALGALGGLEAAVAKIDALPPEKLAALHGPVKMLKKMIDYFDDTLHAQVELAGELADGQGNVLYLKPIEIKTILPTIGWEMLRQRFGEERLLTAVEIHKTPLINMVKDAVLKGKGKAVEEFLTVLENAGALERSTRKTLTVKKEG